MAKSPSSISSSDRVHGSGATTIRALCWACAAVVVLDLAIRVAGRERLAGWDYWSPSAASKYLSYAHLRRSGAVPGVLVTGDSSGDYGFDPGAFDEVLGCRRCSYNLATLGNFPLAFHRTFSDLTFSAVGPNPAVVLIILVSGGFAHQDGPRPTERSILSSPVVRRAAGERPMGDFVALSRIWRARVQVLEQLRGGQGIDSLRGFRARTSSPGVIRRREVAAPYLIDTVRMAAISRAIAKTSEIGVRAVLVHPPVHSFDDLRWNGRQAYADSVKALADRLDFAFWDYSEDHSFDDQMVDLVHLSSTGAARFSALLARRMALEFPDAVPGAN